jgi:carbamoyl-phosphate synthase large subunit
MEIVYTPDDLRRYIRTAVKASPDRPVLVDRFLEDATEVDVDCLSDGTETIIGGVMEHIEEAGVHSGDSACVIPSFSLSPEVLAELKSAAKAMARELHVRGLMNVQFAVKDGKVYVLEVNPRASRTVPYVSKAIGVPLAKLAAKVMAGHTLKELGVKDDVVPRHFAVKEAVFPFIKFPGIDISLGPEMRSTGEVMGLDPDLGVAYAKAQMSAQPALPESGNVFISVKDADKSHVVPIAREFAEAGFKIHATRGTLGVLQAAGVEAEPIYKLSEGRPNVLDLIKNGEMQFIINTPHGKIPRQDEVAIRSAAVANRIPIMTTLRGARMSVRAIKAIKAGGYGVKCLQEYQA